MTATTTQSSPKTSSVAGLATVNTTKIPKREVLTALRHELHQSKEKRTTSNHCTVEPKQSGVEWSGYLLRWRC
jgi:hypothetical protein